MIIKNRIEIFNLTQCFHKIQQLEKKDPIILYDTIYIYLYEFTIIIYIRKESRIQSPKTHFPKWICQSNYLCIPVVGRFSFGFFQAGKLYRTCEQRI